MKRSFTEEEIKLLSDPNLTAKELCVIFKVKTDKTISRWRKSIGVKISVGSKKGKPKPFQLKKVNYTCLVCNIIFEGIPSKKRKLCSRKCLNIFSKSIDKSYMQTEEYKDTLRNPNLPAYTKYARKVRKLSELNYVKFHNLINPYNWPRTLCGVDGGYQLDHKISIKECWNKGLPPEEAAKPENLQMITWQENLNKRKFDPIINYGNIVS